MKQYNYDFSKDHLIDYIFEGVIYYGKYITKKYKIYNHANYGEVFNYTFTGFN